MVAESWHRRLVRDFAARCKVVNTVGEELAPFSITKARGVVLQSQKYKKQIATDLRKYVVARRGQFAFDPMSLYYGAIGLVRAADIGLVSPDYVVFEADGSVDHGFLDYLLRSPEQVARYESVAETGNQFGKRRRVYWSVFEELAFLLPPLAEQRKIAAILSSVDAAIGASQAVIDQLQVVKKAMMAELLTKGLPGRHKKFKQTETGQVPAEWEVVPLSEIAQLQTGVAKGKKPDDAVELPYLRVANVQDGYVDLSEMKTILVEKGAVTRYRLKTGDVLFTEGGDADKLGRGCVWQGQVDPCLHQNHVFAVRPNPERLLSQYLAYAAASPRGKQYFLDSAKQTTNLASINSTQLKALPIPLASIEEQSAIVASISSVDSRLAVEISALGSLQTAKESLISVLLTGEVRVRVDEEAAA